MKWHWFTKKKIEYPQFWVDYINTFNTKPHKNIEDTRFIAFDTETTGFDRKTDRILSIGAVSITNKTIATKDAFELYLQQEIFKADTVKIHEIMKSDSLNKVEEIEAIKHFLAYIKNDVLVAHHAMFDYTMVNAMLKRHGLGKLKNKIIDTGKLYKKTKHIIYQDNLKNYSLDELSEELNVPMVDRHTASGDALITAVAFLKIKSRLKKRDKLNWKTLFY